MNALSRLSEALPSLPSPREAVGRVDRECGWGGGTLRSSQSPHTSDTSPPFVWLMGGGVP
jgi:hypothetical protein